MGEPNIISSPAPAWSHPCRLLPSSWFLHLMDLDTPTHIAMTTTRKHKLPGTTRLADHDAGVLKKEVPGGNR